MRRKIKIVWLCTPFGFARGGIWRRLTNWARFLDWNRFDVTFIFGGINPEAIYQAKQDLERLGPIKCIYLDGLYPVYRLTIKGFMQLLNCLKGISPEILHTIFIQSDIIGGLVRKMAGVKVHISSIEGPLVPWFASSWKKKLYKLGYSIVRKDIDAIIALCQATKNEAVRDFGAPLEKFHVIYSGVNLKEFPLKNGWPYKASQNTHVVGSIARLSKEKNLDLLISVIPNVLKYYPEVRFAIGGEGPEEENLKTCAKRLGVYDRINFLGKIEHVADILHSFDIFVLTSNFEGLPWAVLEAQAVGVPVIAQAVGGIPEVIQDGVSGLLLHENDSWKLAERIIWLLEHREIAAQMAIKGRQLGESKFTIEREIAEIQELYEFLVYNNH